MRALGQEGVLARPRAEALAEQHDLGPGCVRHPAEPLGDRVDEEPSLSVTFSDTVERQRRRPRRVLHRDGRAVPTRQHLEHADGGIVHVSSAGGHVDEQPLTIEGVRTVELAHRELDPLDIGLGALEADVDADDVHRVLAHDLRDHLGRLRVPHEASTLLRHRVVRNLAVDAAAQGRGRRRHVERRLDRFFAILDHPEAALHRVARDPRDRRERHDVSEGAPQRLVARQHAAGRARDAVGEPALTGGHRRSRAHDGETHRQRFRHRDLTFGAGRLVGARSPPAEQLAADGETGRRGHDHEPRRPVLTAPTIQQLLQATDERCRRHRWPRRTKPPARAPARGSRSLSCRASARCTPSPPAIAAASTASVARLHRRSSTASRPAAPRSKSAADCSDSCKRLTNVWFAANDSPVINA